MEKKPHIIELKHVEKLKSGGLAPHVVELEFLKGGAITLMTDSEHIIYLYPPQVKDLAAYLGMYQAGREVAQEMGWDKKKKKGK